MGRHTNRQWRVGRYPAPGEGISKALITTLMGLMVAIPVLSAYTFFRNRVTRVMLEVGVITGDLLDRFRPVQ